MMAMMLVLLGRAIEHNIYRTIVEEGGMTWTIVVVWVVSAAESTKTVQNEEGLGKVQG